MRALQTRKSARHAWRTTITAQTGSYNGFNHYRVFGNDIPGGDRFPEFSSELDGLWRGDLSRQRNILFNFLLLSDASCNTMRVLPIWE